MLLRLARHTQQAQSRARGSSSFALSLNEKDLELLRDLQTFFGCGWIRRSKADRTLK
jgi:hypothetical protein